MLAAILAFSVIIGGVLALLLLLNRRDRRRDALHARIGTRLADVDLRGMVAIRVTMPVIAGRARASLDMRACTQADVARLLDALARSELGVEIAIRYPCVERSFVAARAITAILSAKLT